jgi:hypothetical protein
MHNFNYAIFTIILITFIYLFIVFYMKKIMMMFWNFILLVFVPLFMCKYCKIVGVILWVMIFTQHISISNKCETV